MTDLKEFVLVLEAREPLSYGEESVGIKMLAKRINLYLPESGRVIAVPVVLGNAIRGVLRDVMAEVFIEEVLNNLEEKPTWHAGALITLFSGGLLKGEAGAERVTAAEVARKVTDVMKKLLPLSVMGCALPGIMVPSKIKITTFYPVCEETRTLVGDLVEKVKEDLKVKLKKALDRSIEDLIMDVQMMRKDDTIKVMQLTRAKGVEITGLEKAVPEEAEGSRRQERRAVQMLFYRQALAPGTLLIGKLTEFMPLSQEELGLLFLSLGRLSSVGGAVARGFGEIVIHNLPEPPKEAVNAFRSFVGEHAEEISGHLAESPETWMRG